MWKKVYSFIIFNLATILAILAVPVWVNGAQTYVENSISVMAESGGNTAESGTAVEDKASVDVSVHSEINGEMVTSIEKHLESSGNDPVQFNLEEITSTADGAGVASTEVKARAGGENIQNSAAAASAQVEVENDGGGPEAERDNEVSSLRFSWRIFLNRLFSYVLGIF